MENPKDRARKALESYYQNQLPKERKIKAKNQRPEKDVEYECLVWMRQQGWDVQIYEAKAVWNPKARRYLSQSMKAGTVDCQGLMPGGVFVAVEFKAPKRISTFNLAKNHRQRQYLIEKISFGAFGCVVSSATRLEQIYNSWRDLKSPEEKRTYLMACLP